MATFTNDLDLRVEISPDNVVTRFGAIASILGVYFPELWFSEYKPSGWI
jgi:hypothetical protein